MILSLRSEREKDLEIERMFSSRNSSTDYSVASQLSKSRVALGVCHDSIQNVLGLAWTAWPSRSFIIERTNNCTCPDIYIYVHIFAKNDHGLPRLPGLAQLKEMWKKVVFGEKIVFWKTVPMGSGWLRVARGGCGAEAPPLAARPPGPLHPRILEACAPHANFHLHAHRSTF